LQPKDHVHSASYDRCCKNSSNQSNLVYDSDETSENPKQIRSKSNEVSNTGRQSGKPVGAGQLVDHVDELFTEFDQSAADRAHAQILDRSFQSTKHIGFNESLEDGLPDVHHLRSDGREHVGELVDQRTFTKQRNSVLHEIVETDQKGKENLTHQSDALVLQTEGELFDGLHLLVLAEDEVQVLASFASQLRSNERLKRSVIGESVVHG